MITAGGISCSGDQWTATVIDDGATVLVPLEPVGANLVGSAGGYNVTIKNPCPQPKRTIQYPANFVSCSCNEAIFSIGDPAICTDPKADGGPCKNETLIKVRWDCCGEFVPDKYYCVSRAEGVGCVPVFLTDEDRCDPDITICDGPFDTELEAATACPSLVGGEDCFDTDGLISPPPCFPGPQIAVPPGEKLYWHFNVTPGFHRLAFDCIFVQNLFGIIIYAKTDCIDAEGAAEIGRYNHGAGGEEEGVEFFLNIAEPTTCICISIENQHDPENPDSPPWWAYIDLMESPDCEEEEEP